MPKKELNQNKLQNKLSQMLKMPSKQKKPDMEQGPVMIYHTGEQVSEIIGTVDSLNREDKSEKYRFEPNQKYFIICIYALGTIALGTFIIYAIMHLSSIIQAIRGFTQTISTFITGFFIAFILNPLVKWFDNRVFHKWLKVKRVRIRWSLSILVTYLLIIGLLVMGFSYVIPQLSTSISDLLKRQEYLYKEAISFLETIEDRFPQIDFNFIEEQLNSLWPQLVNYGTNLAMDVFPKILSLGISIAKVTINALLSVAISIYMLYDKRNLSKIMIRLAYSILPIKKAFTTTATLKECGSIFSSFVIGKSIDSLIIGIICFIAMTIIGLPYTMLISVIVGITNMIPYFGPFIGAIPGILLFLCIQPINAVIFTIMIFIIQQFDGWILGPMILGESTGIGPLWVIFAITVGGAYAGVLGMFLGVPVIAVIAYLSNRIIEGKLNKKHINVT